MKPIIVSLTAAFALAACAAPNSVATSSPKSAAASQSGYATVPVGDGKYEITFAGPWAGSRDAIEGRLLYNAALLARQHGNSWFRLLHLPGEAGPNSHPARPSPGFGAAYGHWQPHWSYRMANVWQPWHPEWSAPFWAETTDTRGVDAVQVHAMIELGRGAFTAAETADFEVAAVLRDLRPARS